MGLRFARKLVEVVAVAAVATWSVEARATRGPSLPADDSRGMYPVTVVGLEALDSKDAEAGETLTRALRKAIDDRGLGGGPELTLVELREALNCDRNEPACLAEGGATLLTDQLLYGTLERRNGVLKIELSLLDTKTGEVVASASDTVRPSDLLPGPIRGTAERLTRRLLPRDDSEPRPSRARSTPGLDDLPPPRTSSRDEGGPTPDTLIAKPVPRWKWAGLGVGIGLTVTGVVMAAVSGVLVSGRLRDDVINAAEASLNDCIDPQTGGLVPCESAGDARNEANDIDPNMSGDLCDAAESSTDALGNPISGGAVRNANVASACEDAITMQNVWFGGLAVVGVGLATTAVFTTLLFFPLRKNRKTAAFLRRQPRLGVTPTRTGAMLAGSIRF